VQIFPNGAKQFSLEKKSAYNWLMHWSSEPIELPLIWKSEICVRRTVQEFTILFFFLKKTLGLARIGGELVFLIQAIGSDHYVEDHCNSKT